MTMSEKKCHFAYQSIELLGHRVSCLGLSTQAQKVEAIMKLPYPKTIREASESSVNSTTTETSLKDLPNSPDQSRKPYHQRRARGDLNSHRTNYRSRNIPKCSSAPFPDTEEIQKAFQELKMALSNTPVLIHSNFNKEFILYMDACRKGVAESLYQIGDNGK